MSYEYSEDNLIEQTAMKLFYEQLGWDTAIAYNNETFGENSTLGRNNKREVVLRNRFLDKLRSFNPGLPDKTYIDALDKLLEETSLKSSSEINFDKYKLFRDGIHVDYINEKGEEIKNKPLKVFDYDDPHNNHFIAVRQLWIEGKSKRERRPDIIGFVNGIPLLFIELKAAHRQLENAFNDNLTDYKDVIPKLFHYNAFIILSNGIESRIGSITGKYRHFHEWKRITESEDGIVALDRVIIGVCEKKRFMDLFENFILYDNSSGPVVKLIARNHLFIGVNKAIENIKEKELLYKEGKIDLQEKQKLGVFWHTQGSGKSYSMVFMCQKIHRKFTGSYTFLKVTDRNELDSQIYGTFSGVGAVPQVKSGSKNSIKATSGKHLKRLLEEQNRYLFSLIHKFNFEKVVTEREDIIVISDEAHRTQGGQLAMNMRNTIPNASFIGFTGTPLFKDDELTRRIFGDYVSKYDFKKSVDDGATVPLYYENRGEYLGLKNPKINEQIRELLDSNEDLDSDQRSRVEQLFARDYPVLTSDKRLRNIAKDVVFHFCNRGYKGKAMFVALDKLIAVKMYDLITHYWQKYIEDAEKILKKNKDDQDYLIKARELDWIRKTEICVVVSSEQNEIKKFRDRDMDIEPHREKMNNRDLETEFKDEDHPFRLVIVCAMWITGFDVPSLSTMYIDKPLKSHTLMQTIARANRVNEGKNNGLIVDYIETYKALLDALAIYGSGGIETGAGGGEIEPPVRPKEELISELEEALSKTETFLTDEVKYEIQELIKASGLEKLAAIEKGINAIYQNDETKKKYQILAREVFKKYKAILPDPVLNKYSPKKNAIDVLYSAIEDNIESADVAEFMKEIQKVVDESIETMVKEPTLDSGKIIDLSRMNFELLKKLFLKAENKNIAVQQLKNKVEKQIQQMLDNNPSRIDFYNRYLEIIEEYNKGKDRVTIEETFNRLIEFINDLSKEEADVIREGLTEEQKAVFDILKKPALTNSEKKKVKEIAIELLDDLKKEKLKVPNVWEKSETTAAVFNYVNNTLFNSLPDSYEKEEIDEKTIRLFDHLRHQYYGNGISVYGEY